MNRFFITFLFPVVLLSQVKPNVELPLDAQRPIPVPVVQKNGITTVFFPSQISAIRGQKIATQESQIPSSDFLLKMASNRFYFSVYALKPGVKQPITVIFNRTPYVLVLEAAAEGKGYNNLTFLDTNGTTLAGSIMKATAKVSANRLLAILDKAKSYDLLAESYPHSYEGVTRKQPNRTINYSGFKVHITDVFRFNKEDVLVLRLIMENLTESEIPFRPNDVGIGVSDRLYPVSLWQSSGIIPAGMKDANGKVNSSQNLHYFLVVGNPEGGRNNLDVDNAWNVYVPRLRPEDLLDNPEIQTNPNTP